MVDVPAGQVVTNDFSQITLGLWTHWRSHHRDGAPDLYPEDLRAEIDQVNAVVFTDVYRRGFAGSQAAYPKTYQQLFSRLDWLTERLALQRYPVGDTITEADVGSSPPWRIPVTTLMAGSQGNPRIEYSWRLAPGDDAPGSTPEVYGDPLVSLEP
jgi:hypothetical protein